MLLLRRLTYFIVLLLPIFGQAHNSIKHRISVPVSNQQIRRLRASDLDTAASNHYGHPGRVQIKVYRGPEHDNYASHGYWLFAIFLFTVVYLVRCIRGYEEGILGQANVQPDLISEATNHHHGHGRVQIKVYRGPSEGHEHFAPHGYWVKQPADDHHG